jgi:Mrp family chromosome partitioning ATPase
MKNLVEAFKGKTEILIIDSPPVLAVTDAVVLSPLVDGVLLVVAPGKTKTNAARNTIEQLQRSQAKILGVVIKFMDGRGRKYARRYGYATRSEYERYYQSADEE